MNKKEWLDKLYYDIGKQQYDFWLCGTYKKNGETLFTKWKKYSECIFPLDLDGTSENWKDQKFFGQINQRQILPIEVVLDLEEKIQLPKIIKELKQMQVKFHIFDTNSRGYHIHLFFSKELTEKEKLRIIKYFKTDEQKAIDKNMIALEFVKHWKTGKTKEEIFDYGG